GRKQVFGNPDLVVAQLLGQLEEAEVVVEAFDHLRQIRKLAQTEDPEPCFTHIVLANIGARMVMSEAGRVKRDLSGAARRPGGGVACHAPASTPAYTWLAMSATKRSICRLCSAALS